MCVVGEAPPVVLPDKWLPLPLRPRFWIPYLLILVGIAVGLEIALNVNHADQGSIQFYLETAAY
jgi:hypothetical protein